MWAILPHPPPLHSVYLRSPTISSQRLCCSPITLKGGFVILNAACVSVSYVRFDVTKLLEKTGTQHCQLTNESSGIICGATSCNHQWYNRPLIKDMIIVSCHDQSLNSRDRLGKEVACDCGVWVVKKMFHWGLESTRDIQHQAAGRYKKHTNTQLTPLAHITSSQQIRDGLHRGGPVIHDMGLRSGCMCVWKGRCLLGYI